MGRKNAYIIEIRRGDTGDFEAWANGTRAGKDLEDFLIECIGEEFLDGVLRRGAVTVIREAKAPEPSPPA